MRLPLEERRKRLAQQADRMVAHYNLESEKEERELWQGGTGVVKMNELAADPGVEALVTKALREFNEINRRQQEDALPDNLRWLARLQRQPSARDLRQLIPKEATLVFEPAPVGEDAPARLQEWREQAADKGLELDARVVERGGELAVELRLTGIEAAIERVVVIEGGE